MREFVDPGALVEMTRKLVAADSQNPPGDEREAARVARQLLEPFTARFTEVEPKAGRTSLVGLVGNGDGSRPTLIVNAHLDVVPVGGTTWTHDPFAGEVADGRIYGRGAADMKGGMAAAIEALAALRRAGLQPACDVAYHLVADEERGGLLGTAVLLEEGLIRGAACIDPEPTSMRVGIAERGVLQATISTRGVPAHASQPHLGVSAIEKAAEIVLALHGADYGEDHALLGKPSCNAGVIQGGSAYNVVAEHCTLKVDRRVLPGTNVHRALDSLRGKIEAIGDPDLSYEISADVFGEASELDPDDAFLATFQRSYQAVLETPGKITGMQFTTDARFVRNRAGIPTVVCGPGDLDQAHRVDESVAVERLVDAAAVYAHLFHAFGGEGG